MVYIVRVMSPYAPCSKFPALKLAPIWLYPETETALNQVLEHYQSVGWGIVDYGKDSDYHYEVISFVGPVPNGFHVETPSAISFDINNSNCFYAIIPNGKTRKDMGV